MTDLELLGIDAGHPHPHRRRWGAVSRLLFVGLLLTLLACAPSAPSPPVGTETAPVEPARTTDAADEDEDEGEESPAPRLAKPTGRTERGQPTPTPVARPRATGLRTEPVVDGLQVPANLLFAPDGRMFLTEVSAGRVRIVDRGSLLAEPFVVVDEASRPENGLLGLVLDPDYASNRYVYLYYSQSRPNEVKPWRNRLLRYTDDDNRGTNVQVVLDDLPIGDKKFRGGHNGGRLAFGPDGKLYVTLGDTGAQETAQDPKALTGKLLRINPDGSVPSDNPFPGSPIFALGLRNAWGLAFHPLSGLPYVTENGGTHHDEVNLIRPGGNYGSPKVQGLKNDPRFLDPLWDSAFERGGISGLAFYTGDLFPQYKNDLLFCTFATSRLIRLRLSTPDYDRLDHEELLAEDCHLDPATGPDGAIYYSSVNRVQRLVPAR